MAAATEATAAALGGVESDDDMGAEMSIDALKAASGMRTGGGGEGGDEAEKDDSELVVSAGTKKRVSRKKTKPPEAQELIGKESGVRFLYEQVPKLKFKKGKGSERHNVNMLMDLYKTWTNTVCPHLCFEDLAAGIWKYGSSYKSADFREHIDLLRDVQGRRSMGEVVDIDEEIKRRTTTRQFANVEVQGAGHDSDADSGVEGAGVGTGAGAGAAAGLGAAAAAPAGAVAGGGGGGGGGAFDHTADPFADDFFANADVLEALARAEQQALLDKQNAAAES